MPKQIKPTTRTQRREQIKQKLQVAPELSDRALARQLGVSPTTVGDVRRNMRKNVQTGHVDTQASEWMKHPYLKSHPEILDGISDRGLRALRAEGVIDIMAEIGSLSPVYAQRELRKRIKAQNRTAPSTLAESDVLIRCDDVHNGLPWIDDNSVDLALSDPPYERAAIPIYRHIATVAGRVLRDGGSLLCMTGQSHLPEVLSALTADKTLRYHWCISYITPKHSKALLWRKVAPAWKPIIWLTKGEYKGNLMYDTIYASADMDDDKEYHHWGQSEQSMAEIIAKFTEPGQTVADFCVGGGSTAVAAVKTGRKFIGSDIDITCVRTTKKRIAELFGDVRR